MRRCGSCQHSHLSLQVLASALIKALGVQVMQIRSGKRMNKAPPLWEWLLEEQRSGTCVEKGKESVLTSKSFAIVSETER